MIKYILYCILYTVPAFSIELFEAEEISTDIWYNTFRHDPYQPEYTDKWTHGGQFNLGIRILEDIRWDNHVHMDGTESQLRNAGWEFQTTYDKFLIQPFYYHHSEHALDKEGNDNRFPQTDRIGIRLCFLGNCRR